MADLSISSAVALYHTTIADDALIPVLDVSAGDGNKGSKITVAELSAKILSGSAILRVSGTLRAYTASASVDASAYFQLDFSAYDGSEWVLTIGGTDYAQAFGAPGVPPASLNLPEGWTFDNESRAATHTDPGGQDVASIATAAHDTEFVLDFTSYNGLPWVLTIAGVDYAQIASIADQAPGSLNLPGDWNTISVLLTSICIASAEVQSVSASQPSTPPTLAAFTDADGFSTAAVGTLDYSFYDGGVYTLTIDGVDYVQPPSAPGVVSGGVTNFPSGWSAFNYNPSTLLLTCVTDYFSHSMSVSASPAPPSVSSATATPPVVSFISEGSNYAAASGQITQVTLVEHLDGKIKLISFDPGFDGNIGLGVQVALYLRPFGYEDGSLDTQITSADTADHCASWKPLAGAVAFALNGKDSGESLVAKLTGGSLTANATECLVTAICSQI